MQLNLRQERLEVPVEQETVWLTQAQMIGLFGRDQSVISRHINNAFKEELDKESNIRAYLRRMHGCHFTYAFWS